MNNTECIDFSQFFTEKNIETKIDAKLIKGYVTKKKFAHCKNQLNDYDFYWRCCICYKLGYCNNYYMKIRNKKIAKNEYEHPYTMVIKGVEGKKFVNLLSFYGVTKTL